MISETIKLLRMNDFYNGGEFTEVAKGGNELALDWKTAKRKIKRKWLLKRN